MNIKSALTALIVQLLADNTQLIRQESAGDQFINSLFGIETDRQRVTRETEAAVSKAVDAAKRVTVDRKVKNITTMK